MRSAWPLVHNKVQGKDSKVQGIYLTASKANYRCRRNRRSTVKSETGYVRTLPRSQPFPLLEVLS